MATIEETKTDLADELERTLALITAWQGSKQTAEQFFTGNVFGGLLGAVMNLAVRGEALLSALAEEKTERALQDLLASGEIETIVGDDGEIRYRLAAYGAS